jgi:hypothetical protein
MRPVVIAPPDARARLLAEHARLRAQLGGALAMARRLVAGLAEPHELDELLAGLRTALARHNFEETGLLERYLLTATDWGPQRVARMLREHLAENELIEGFLALPAAEVAGELADLAEKLNEHMAAEERTFLRAALFADG